MPLRRTRLSAKLAAVSMVSPRRNLLDLERVEMLVPAAEVKHPSTGEVLIENGTLIDEEASELLDDHGVERASVRTALFCRSPRGMCAKCYGRDLASGRLVNVGEAVGVIAAQSIGEPGTQLTMRTFHFGGTVTHKVEKNTLDATFTGRLQFNNVKIVSNREGKNVVLSRAGEIKILDNRKFHL